ncbi:WD repeat-containing protein on Y chromosome-like [Pungitius pungitius]|uniref:WD repeat-containing protein on Y chromosome-like n=1 Tax=Pungitius pungitius TaxID=134920 RepID=UPI002E13C09B
MFSGSDISGIRTLFETADLDRGGRLDIDEFCAGLKEVLGTDNNDELISLFHKIDTNCDGSVDFPELAEYLVCKKNVSIDLDDVFHKSMKVVPMNHYKNIVQVIFHTLGDDKKPECEASVVTGQSRTYQTGQYMTISSDGMLTFLSDKLDISHSVSLNTRKKAIPFSHVKKMWVNGMTYMEEFQELAIITSEREVLFYDCKRLADKPSIAYALIVEVNTLSVINYGFYDKKAVLSFGDVEGFLYVLISHRKWEFFSPKAFEKISLRKYRSAYVSTLLNNTFPGFRCVKIPIFKDICTQIQYSPTIDSLVICGSSSKTMVLMALHGYGQEEFSKTVYESTKKEASFTCVQYASLHDILLTGGTDGKLRQWWPGNTFCSKSLPGHVKPITHITVNSIDKIVVTLSEDRNVRVWSEDDLLPLQSFVAKGMEHGPITSVCHNTYNNELVLANTKLGSYFGRGTDVYKKALKSHDMPICGALYHRIHNQVISICQNGVVSVWDVLTGKATARFNVNPDPHVGHTAIAFDGPQRRLITASPDGKLRLWNFNNGKLLTVLPVALPIVVTDLVCYKNSVFVSGRNSKTIYVVDIEGRDNRILRHPFLDDISSMDVHEEILIVVSSNNNIVVWNAETADVLSWINSSKSPKTIMAMEKEQGLTGSLPVEKNHNKFSQIPKNQKQNQIRETTHVVKCLRTREVKADTATLLSAADGYICAWSVNVKGGLLAKFRAVDEEGAVITTMTTDMGENTLLTGDSAGNFCHWDIKTFGFKTQATEEPFEIQNGWPWSVAPPPLLGSWRCHTKAVVSVQSDRSCKMFITAGLDCNLCLWGHTGSHIGVFGKDKWNADLSLEEVQKEEPGFVPASINTENEIADLPKPLQLPLPMSKLEKRRDQIDMVYIPLKLDEEESEVRVEKKSKVTVKKTQPLRMQTTYDYGGVRSIQHEDTFKDAVLKSIPSTLPGKQQRKKIRPLRFPLISDSVQPRLNPQPPGTSAHSPIRSGAEPRQHRYQINPQPRAAEHVRFPPIRNGVQPRHQLTQLNPQPPKTSDHVHLPPICAAGVQPRDHPTQLNPHPPAGPASTLRVMNQQRSLKNAISKYGRLLKIQQNDTLEDMDLKPCRPSPPIAMNQQSPETLTNTVSTSERRLEILPGDAHVPKSMITSLRKQLPPPLQEAVSMTSLAHGRSSELGGRERKNALSTGGGPFTLGPPIKDVSHQPPNLYTPPHPFFTFPPEIAFPPYFFKK